MSHEIKKLNTNEVELTVVVASAEVAKEVEKVTSEVGSTLTLSGFRAGKAPLDMVRRAVGDDKIKDEVVSNLISRHLLKVLQAENLSPVVNPNVEKIDFEFDKDFTFTTKITTYPEVKITGYDKIKVKRPQVEKVTDKEIDEVVANLFLQVENPPARENVLVNTKGEKLTLGNKTQAGPDDEFAKKMGAADLADLKKKVRENMDSEKEVLNERDWETQILEDVVKKTKVVLPETLIEVEIDNILRKIVYDLSSMQMTFEDYLKSQNKTIEEMKKQYRESAVKTLTAQLALNEIAKLEKYEISDDEIEKALPKEAEGHIHSAQERAQMHSWLIQRKALAYLKSLQDS